MGCIHPTLLTFLQYAIRPAVRGNEKFKRDAIIKTVADVVGPEHPVDLKNYDLMILVDVVQVSLARESPSVHGNTRCQNVIGMSVVGSDYDKLKRFNLAELYDPTPKPTQPQNMENEA